MFNAEKFDENVDYCRYVYNKSINMGLDLDDNDIQIIANLYAFELFDQAEGDEIIDDEELLLDILDQYLNPKALNKEVSQESMDDYILLQLLEERRVHSGGGYAYIDANDDLSFEDIQSKLTRKKH